MTATLQHADIKVERASTYGLRIRGYVAFPTHGHGLATGMLEALAALNLAHKKWGQAAGIRPLGNSLYAVRFEQ